MKQARIWQVMASRLAAFTLVMFVTAGLLAAQTLETSQTMRMDVPFEFSVDSKVLPAGKYTFSVDTFGLAVTSATSGKIHGSIVARLSGPAQFLRDGALVFDRSGGGHALAEVWMPGIDGMLLYKSPNNHERTVLAVSAIDQSGSLSGKKAFELTCARCHGSDGNGDQRADKFFGTTIPRLTSAQVQGKTDKELTELITQGDTRMPPVEIDESGFRHRLPPQDVEAVIVYLRALKPSN
jgi:mono/diheme cytochrome c family protein